MNYYIAVMAEKKPAEPPREVCDRCGSVDLWWRNCKLLCKQCHAIVKSCSDL
jgi:hypothetical protein